jgi:hypothetical protein
MTRMTVAVLGAILFFETLVVPRTGHARCECRCVNGQVVPLCESAVEVPPVCPPRVCPVVPPAVRPVDPPRVPPVGTKICRSEQVYNQYTQRYEWKEVCR